MEEKCISDYFLSQKNMNGLEKNFLIFLMHYPKMTNSRIKKILDFFPSYADFWKTPHKTLFKSINWKPELIHDFIEWKKKFNTDEIIKTYAKEQIICVSTDETHYPKKLLSLPNPPTCLFVKGSLQHTKKHIAIIGSRDGSEYGKNVTRKIIQELEEFDCVIVSGLARGIDATAHENALVHKKNTMAVLAGGVDIESIRPKMHVRLAEKIITGGGTVISQKPAGHIPGRFDYPERNQLMAKLVDFILIIEAKEKSGTLITAEFGKKYQTPIGAIPNSIYAETGTGTNNLLREKAHVITKGDDILKIFGYTQNKETEEQQNKPLSLDEKILQFIKEKPRQNEELCLFLNITAQVCASALTLLELKNQVKKSNGFWISV